jgi:hypothetical protein
MHARQWLATEGTIVDAEPAHGRHEHHYTIEIRKSDGSLIRRQIKHKDQVPYQVGTKIRAEISDTNEIRFDPLYHGGASIISVMDMTDQIRAASEAFDAPGARGPDFGNQTNVVFNSGTDGAAAFAGLLGAAGATVSVIGPDGQPLQVDPAKITPLAQAILSGDPALRESAAEVLRMYARNEQPLDTDDFSG